MLSNTPPFRLSFLDLEYLFFSNFPICNNHPFYPLEWIVFKSDETVFIIYNDNGFINKR